MMSRPRAAQLLLAVAGISMFLPWASSDVALLRDAQGVDTNEGVLVLLVSLATIGLIRIGLRPAWMGAGLVFAVAGREILSISDHANASPGTGLWISFAAGGGATILLVIEMFGAITRPASDT